MKSIPSSEITPEHVYINRRQFLAGLGITAAGLALGGCACPQPEKQPPTSASTGQPTPASTGQPTLPPTPVPTPIPQPSTVPPNGSNGLTTFEAITTYNNFYEFSLAKDQVAELAEGFVTSPWEIEVGGLVNNPQTFTLEDIFKFEQEERIYRMRCVEAWSMVIPWNGFPLRKLLEAVEPASDAKYVRFETLYDPEQMPGQEVAILDWPYTEGLRLDEAMHNLTILATGLYGNDLLPQNGAPVRLVVPWKYGFKSIKSIVKIELVKSLPSTSWVRFAPDEYGFFANVNPNVPHPRWSQASERRIGETGRRETLLFNGYEEEVAHLYTDLNLELDF